MARLAGPAGPTNDRHGAPQFGGRAAVSARGYKGGSGGGQATAVANRGYNGGALQKPWFFPAGHRIPIVVGWGRDDRNTPHPNPRPPRGEAIWRPIGRCGVRG